MGMQSLCLSDACCLEQLAGSIEDEYDMEVRQIKNVDGDNYIANTGNTLLLVQKQDCSETHLIYITNLYQYIIKRGFRHILKIYRTKTGRLYMRGADGLYIVTDYIEETDFLNYGDEQKLVKLLADFHKSAQGYIPPSGGKGKSDWGVCIEKYRKEHKCLKDFRDIVENKEDKSRFDILFLNNCNEYLERMEKSIDILRKRGYLDIVEDSMKKRHVCIGSIKQSIFCKYESEMFIRSLCKCKYNILESDIADLLEKVIKGCNTSSSVFQIRKLISLYNYENTLSENSIDIIKAFLLFPSEYEKVCSRYHRGKNKYDEDGFIERLLTAMGIEDKKKELAGAL
jgi:CotS family spore coat protein